MKKEKPAEFISNAGDWADRAVNAAISKEKNVTNQSPAVAPPKGHPEWHTQKRQAEGEGKGKKKG